MPWRDVIPAFSKDSWNSLLKKKKDTLEIDSIYILFFISNCARDQSGRHAGRWKKDWMTFCKKNKIFSLFSFLFFIKKERKKEKALPKF